MIKPESFSTFWVIWVALVNNIPFNFFMWTIAFIRTEMFNYRFLHKTLSPIPYKFTLDLYWLNLLLNLVTVEPTYCFSEILHIRKQATFLLLQLTEKLILYCLPVFEFQMYLLDVIYGKFRYGSSFSHKW